MAAFFRIKFGSSSGPDAFPPFKPSSNLVRVVLNFFVLKIQKVCFFKKDHLADMMARWVCRLHNLYFAQRSALFVRLALLYKDVFFRIDARSDLDSQGRFSITSIVMSHSTSIVMAAFFRIKFGSSSGPDAFPPFKPSSNLVRVVLNFFVLKIQKVCFFKKDHLADMMARWVCRLHNLYFAQRSALFVRLALLYKDGFFRMDARSDLDSQGRFSITSIVMSHSNHQGHC